MAKIPLDCILLDLLRAHKLTLLYLEYIFKKNLH